jgi:glucuronate isomerase
MSASLHAELLQEINSWTLVDPHTHINPLAPASTNFVDLLGYHYYTELAHSAGMPRERIEEPGIDPKEKVRRLVLEGLPHLDNTAQLAWLLEICDKLLGLPIERLEASNWEQVYDRALEVMAAPDWAQQVLDRSRLSAVFLTNDFDDPLQGFDTRTYIPCLRTDDLVFNLWQPSVQQRLRRVAGREPTSPARLREILDGRFAFFTERGARACAISLPPDFTPHRIPDAVAQSALDELWTHGPQSGRDARQNLAAWVFWNLTELCQAYRLPFDLMIGVRRQVYPGGVFQGQDLYDSRVSLIQYAPLWNAFPKVRFPVSVLASVTNQELVDYAWIFPNVIPHGHWWYSNTPSFVRRDLEARLEAVPRNKLIGYYSDMYKLEFGLPKFSMYRRILAGLLAERYVIERGWTNDRALELAKDILVRNVQRVFGEAATD